MIVEEYRCETLDDVADLYATFDTRESVRSQREVNNVVASVTEGLESVPANILAILVGGMNFHFNPNGGIKNKSGRERAAIVRDHVPFVQFFMSLAPDGKFANGFKYHLCRVGVVAAVFAIWLEYQEESRDFWEKVRDGDGSSDPKEARRRLNALLAGIAASRGKGGRGVADSKDIYKKCLKYWNNYRTNKVTGAKRSRKIPEIA